MKPGDSIDIPVPVPFSFGECLKFLGRSTNESLFTVESGRVLMAFRTSKGDVLAVIAHPKNKLTVTALKGKGNEEEVRKYIADWLDLDTDITPFYRLAEKDKLLAPLVKSFYGLRLIGIPDLFEAFAWAITGQQINLAFAYTLKRRLVESFGESIMHDGTRHYIFPRADVIAGLAVNDLKPLQYSEKKAEYLINIAQKFSSGELSKEQLVGMSREGVEQKLVSIRGIGKWTAHYVMMKSLKDHSAFPVADVGLQNAIKHLLGLPAKPAAAEVERMGRKWKGWEAYATFYLWRSLY